MQLLCEFQKSGSEIGSQWDNSSTQSYELAKRTSFNSGLREESNTIAIEFITERRVPIANKISDSYFVLKDIR